MGVLDWLRKKPDPQTGKPMVAPAELGLSLGIDLYTRLRTQPGNLLFSPASIWLAFALAYGGARKQTASQMERGDMLFIMEAFH